MTVSKGLVAALLFGAVAGCSQQENAAGGPVAATSEDACGAAQLQSLVGTSVGTLDSAALPEPRRVIFPGQPVTMDYREERLNVEIGKDDKVVRVYCG
jgi:hypothetical protein